VWYKTWSLILNREDGLRVLEKIVMMKIFMSKG
jgi:hypothetical protein